MTATAENSSWHHLIATAGGSGRFAALFWLLVVATMSLHWISPRLPMVDLPQHAAQIVALRDLLWGDYLWQEHFYTDLLTPYLLPYLLSAALALVFDVKTVIALLLSGAYLGFVVLTLRLRQRFAAAAELDWLVIPVFFGVTWQWGSYPFLLAAPLVLLFVLQAYTYTQTRSLKDASKLLLSGALLSCTHLLAFIFAGLIGGLFELVRVIRRHREILFGWPYLLLLAALLGWVLSESGQVINGDSIKMGSYAIRMVQLILFPFDGDYQAGLVYLFAMLWAAPVLFGLRPRRDSLAPYVPLLAFSLVWLFVPAVLFGTYFVYQRFIIFALPFYLLIFAGPVIRGARFINLITVGIVTVFIGYTGHNLYQFRLEQQDFVRLMNAMEPGQRALFNVSRDDGASPAFDHQATYLQWPMWYAAERQGWADFSFAIFFPQPVQYRQPPLLLFDLIDRGQPFNWQQHDGATYRYFILRGDSELTVQWLTTILGNGQCEIKQVPGFGSWHLLERGDCRL
jgi:hypothetical protein